MTTVIKIIPSSVKIDPNYKVLETITFQKGVECFYSGKKLSLFDSIPREKVKILEETDKTITFFVLHHKDYDLFNGYLTKLPYDIKVNRTTQNEKYIYEYETIDPSLPDIRFQELEELFDEMPELRGEEENAKIAKQLDDQLKAEPAKEYIRFFKDDEKEVLEWLRKASCRLIQRYEKGELVVVIIDKYPDTTHMMCHRITEFQFNELLKS